MALRGEKFSVLVSKAMLQEIEDFQFDNRITSKSKAAGILIEMGLEVYRERKAAGLGLPEKDEANRLSEDEEQILDDYRALGARRKTRAQDDLADLRTLQELEERENEKKATVSAVATSA